MTSDLEATGVRRQRPRRGGAPSGSCAPAPIYDDHRTPKTEEERNGPAAARPGKSRISSRSRRASRATRSSSRRSRSAATSAGTMRVDCGQLDPAAVIRPEPGEWHPRMPERLDDEELAGWRAGHPASSFFTLSKRKGLHRRPMLRRLAGEAGEVFPSRFRAQPHGTPSANRPSIAHRRSGRCLAQPAAATGSAFAVAPAAPPRYRGPSFPICCGHWRHHRKPSRSPSRARARMPPRVAVGPRGEMEAVAHWVMAPSCGAVVSARPPTRLREGLQSRDGGRSASGAHRPGGRRRHRPSTA